MLFKKNSILFVVGVFNYPGFTRLKLLTLTFLCYNYNHVKKVFGHKMAACLHGRQMYTNITR